ncbi:hypothetical protein I4U23_010722 [Adineta vaga]|nr:hypothetical protein I4U23_010722 [Adineta vaga]
MENNLFRCVFTIADGCVYVWIVKTGECLRLINQNSNSNSNSNDQQAITVISKTFYFCQLCTILLKLPVYYCNNNFRIHSSL